MRVMRQSLVYNITVYCTAGTVPVCPRLLKHGLFIILRTWQQNHVLYDPLQFGQSHPTLALEF